MGTDSLGVNRIAKTVYAGLNTSLLRLELAANERQIAVLDVDGEPTGELRTLAAPQIEDDGEKSMSPDRVIYGDDLPFAQIKPFLSDALAKNYVLREATRHTAVQLLPVARVLCHAIAITPTSEEIKSTMDAMVREYAMASVLPGKSHTPPNSYTTTSTTSSTTVSESNLRPLKASVPPQGTCPLLSLPPELVTQILRAYTTLEPVPLPPNPSLANVFNPCQATSPVFASALSEQQFRRILHLAQDRTTLKGYTHRYHQGRNSLNGTTKDSRNHGRISLHNSAAFLEYVGCQEYERRSS